MKTLDVYIGYDPREAIAYHVCANSIIRNASRPVRITPLAKNLLPKLEVKHQEGYPPSNDFIFSRFLVPYINGHKGLALFMDGDMVVNGDIAELFDGFKWGHSVEVVKHDYVPKDSVKYLGAVQRNYPRKNWSSVMLFDTAHSHCQRLTPGVVAKASGEYLHRFEWTDDFRIGELPKGWNYLADEDNQEPNPENRKLIHYTRGTVCFKDYESCEHSLDWWKEYNKTIHANDASARIVKVPIV